jgi:hypothetical protein
LKESVHLGYRYSSMVNLYTEQVAVDSTNWVSVFSNPDCVLEYSPLAEKAIPHPPPSKLALADKDYSYSSIDDTS